MPLKDIIRGLRAVVRAWNWFWFREVSAKGTGLMRILLGFMLVATSIDLFPLLPTLIGPEGIHDADAAARGIRAARWTYFDYLPDMTAVYIAHGLALVANVLFMVGYKSRLMGLISVLAHAALYQRNSWFMNGGDRLIREMTLYLSLVPCGAALSFDAWRARLSGSHTLRKTIPILGLRLVQIQICYMYCSSGILKAQHSSWERGTALYYSLSSGSYHRSEAWVAPLLDNVIGQNLCEILTHITLYWEIWFPLLILWRPMRWIALTIGVLFHLGVQILLCVAFFGFISTWGYLAFLPYDWVERVEQWWDRRRDRPQRPSSLRFHPSG